MGLSNCFDCGGAVSTHAPSCLHCGCRLCKDQDCTAPVATDDQILELIHQQRLDASRPWADEPPKLRAIRDAADLVKFKALQGYCLKHVALQAEPVVQAAIQQEASAHKVSEFFKNAASLVFVVIVIAVIAKAC